MTWLHAQLALATLAREHAREALRVYGAHAAALSDKDGRKAWRSTITRQAGWGS